MENHHHYHNHHHSQQEADKLSASLQAFQSYISSWITNLLLKSDESEILSLKWIEKCFQVLPMINKAFAKLIMEIDYHMSNWKAKTMEDYLKYSLELLDFLNSISSSLSYLRKFRVSLSHAVSVMESSPSLGMEKLKGIITEFKKLKKNEFKNQENKEEEREGSFEDKEWVIHQALTELRSLGFWVCSVVLTGLSGDAKPLIEMKKFGEEFSNPILIDVNSSICTALMEKGCVLKEVKDLKESAVSLEAAMEGENRKVAAEDLQKKLQDFEKLLDNLTEEVDHFFSEVLVGRDELLNGIRFKKKP